MNGAPQATPAPTSAQSTLDADIALLGALLAQSDAGDEHTADSAELQALLQRLEAADGVARGVESRLDAIIGDLDRMLGGLEGEGEGEGGERADGEEEEQLEDSDEEPVVVMSEEKAREVVKDGEQGAAEEAES